MITEMNIDQTVSGIVENYKHDPFTVGIADYINDCMIVTDESDEHNVYSRRLLNCCPALIPRLSYNEQTRKYTVRTSVPSDIVSITVKLISTLMYIFIYAL